MTEKNLLIYGTGTISEIASFYFNHDTNYKIIGYVDNEKTIQENDEFLGKKLYSWKQIKEFFSPDDVDIFIAIGYKKTNKIREEKFKLIQNDGFSFASYVSTKANVFTDKIGQNCFILENNVVQPFVEIGNNVFLWSGNHIGHHSRIHDNVFISSHVVISGKCEIGKNSFLGVNSCLRDGIKIGEKSVIGLGTVVMKNCPSNSVFIQKGSESRIISKDII